MTRYVVLLRGVNVGGHNKVPMATLRDLATDLGYTDVVTYVQSGNLVVTADATAEAIESSVAAALRRELDVDVAVIVRSRDELAAVISANPFVAVADDDAKLLVSLLAGEPAPEKVKALDANEFEPELFAVGDRCLYQWLPDGAGRSKLVAAPWGRRLGVVGTARNWRTLTKLLELCG